MAYPTPPVPPMEPADFSAPSFGGIAPMPAPVPAPMAAPAPIVTPPSLPSGPMAPTGAPRFPQATPPKEDLASTIVTLIPALLGGLKDPKLIGAAMRGIQKGRDEKFARTEHIQQSNDRRQKEAADFYGRAIEQSQTIDDPADFERWRTMIGPTAQLYGIDPAVFVFNATKAQKKQQASLVTQLDAMEKRDPSLVSREDFKIVTPEYPQGVDVATVRTWRGQATDNSGKQILAKPNTDKSLTPRNVTVNGKRLTANYNSTDGKFYDQQTGAVIPGAVLEDATDTSRPQRVEGLLDGKPAFAFQVGTKFQDSNGGDVTARFRPLQTPQERSDAASAAATQPVKPLLRGTPDYQTAQDLAAGKLTFQQFARLYPSRAKNDNTKARIYMTARELNPDFSPADFEIGMAFAKNPQIAQRKVAIRSLYPVIDQIEALSSQIGNGDVQAFNRLLNGAKIQLSQQPVANFQQLKTLLGDEVGLALGVGSGSDLKTKLGIDLVDTNLSDGSFQSSMEQLRKILGSREQNLNDLSGPYSGRSGGSGTVQKWGRDAQGHPVRLP